MERNRNLIHSERLGLISSKLEEIKGLIEEVKELIKEEKGDYAEKTNMGQPYDLASFAQSLILQAFPQLKSFVVLTQLAP